MVVGAVADLVGRHREQLGVGAALVFGVEHRHGAAFDDAAGHDWMRGQHQHVNRVAIAGEGFGDVAIIGRVAHRHVHEAIHREQAGLLVHFVFHRRAVGRNLDDNDEFVRRFGARAQMLKTHEAPS